ncbi:glycosyl hydrolase-related protein [Bacillus kwashiorkori]|uniref:glycoside hydrolase family 38 N-terminal domain-containing protein n=1 Tax=Bacillus kwashiorkori TaxID=1522318 RepID=UPI000781A711|nr:glycoside hydrolase family 38 C-terminal domain-containing protein [Bacillus kwashiorkori]
MDNIKEVSILNHTHWDREWYETFEEFRYKLRNGISFVMDLLDEGKLDNFFLDGQTIVLDDFKEVVDETEYEKLLSYIKQGKIEVGPWYLLADEFLISGESVIKNLEIGMKEAKKLNAVCNTGYLPDTFGHISQMPQILKGFQIDNALIFRGAISDRLENEWEGADGTSIFTIVLPLFEGYYQTFLKHSDYVEKTKNYLEANAPYLTFGKALIMNGADHTFPSADLAERIHELKKAFPSIEFKQHVLSTYFDLLKNQQPVRKIKGEQRDPSKIFILPGVYSSRSYLKNQNQLCEDQALGVMEALNVWNNGENKADKFIEYVWKQILQNQPHDSICGCSVDEVHDEMETRTQKILSAIRQFSKDTLNELYPFEFLNKETDNNYLYLINNTPIADIYPVSAAIRIPIELDTGNIKLLYNQEEVPFDIVNRVQREEFLHNIFAEPHYGEYVTYNVTFNLKFDGVEIKKIRIVRDKAEANITTNTICPSIENEFYRINWDEKGLIITDLETNIVYRNQHQLISSLDAGDTYNYSPPKNDFISTAELVSVSNIKKGNTFESVELHYVLKQPASLNEDRTGPSEQYVENRIKTTVTLHNGKRFIYFKTGIDNKARDQKLRVGFAVHEANDSFADTAFDVLRRKVIREKQYDVPRNKEAVMNQYPTYSSVFVNEHQLIHRGLQEYEVDSFNRQDYVFLTMIRSVGWLSRRDLRTRGNGAGPGFETPGAQCLGSYEFEYGLTLGKRNMSLNNAKMMRQPILYQQSYQDKAERKLFKQTSTIITFSSFRLIENDTFEIRMFNPSEEQQNTKINFGFIPEKIVEVDFTGNIITQCKADQEVSIHFGPKQIKTIRVVRKSSN